MYNNEQRELKEAIDRVALALEHNNRFQAIQADKLEIIADKLEILTNLALRQSGVTK